MRNNRPTTPDFNAYPVAHDIVAATISDKTVDVTWDDGAVSRYLFIWLRDNCPSPETFDPVTREQLLDITEIPWDIHPERVEISDAGGLLVAWSHGGHSSHYHPGWLRAHSDEALRRAAAAQRPETWDAGFVDRLPRVDGRAALADDEALFDWLCAARTYGLALLTGLPRDDGIIEAVGNRIGIIRETNFGRLFDVRSKPDPDSSAYTPIELPPHTDLPTRELQPGLQLLHCLVNDAEGGESIFVDGFRVAEVIQAEQPKHFETLCRLPWTFVNKAKVTDYRWKAPILATDHDGRVIEVRWGNFLRGPLEAAPAEIEAGYAAARAFVALTKDPAYQAVFRLEPGELAMFDNRRVLHARKAFDPQSGARHLRGCYVDRDELLSRIRMLERARARQADAAAAATPAEAALS